jgi:hypothetical protein
LYSEEWDFGIDEMALGLDSRKSPFLYCDTMLGPIHSDNLEYKELTKAG